MTTEDAPHIQLPIETARLTLDPPSEADDEAMGRMFSDVETMAYLRFKTKEPHGWTKPDIVDRRELQEAGIAKGKVSTYYIHDKRTGELAGVCGANHIHMDERRSDVGIILWKKYWSGGYGTEALYEVMRDLFEERKMHKVRKKKQKRKKNALLVGWNPKSSKATLANPGGNGVP